MFHLRERYARDTQSTIATNAPSDENSLNIPHAPKSGLTPIVPRFIHDLRALSELATSSLPPLRVVRPTLVVQVFYGFGDASGKGFGSTVAGNYNCSRSLVPANSKEMG